MCLWAALSIALAILVPTLHGLHGGCSLCAFALWAVEALDALGLQVSLEEPLNRLAVMSRNQDMVIA